MTAKDIMTIKVTNVSPEMNAREALNLLFRLGISGLPVIGEDKKLRYPRFLRTEIYKNMLDWIKTYDSKTPVYLCMEDSQIWQIVDNNWHL